MKIKEAKKYLGRIVKIEDNYGLGDVYYCGITRDIESFSTYLDFYRGKKATEFKENVILYKVDIKRTDGKLETLFHIRDRWAKGCFDYSDFCTKEQIKILLKKGYLVAVNGLQEIDLNDLDKLENSNLEINWKLDKEGNFYL